MRTAVGSFARPARAVSSLPTWSEALSVACVVADGAGLDPFNADQRLLDQDPYCLNMNLRAACSSAGSSP